ncbi:DMT family transporter [Chelatococcus reniformis]|uniref:EamA domain-containing protein n=1 Tax=Chelatococcus reniformis TaxID=1494448 RepID=A0A916TX87_9HYPH|nr:DMT family transporter [Chelatococcus reniformis]GGC45660.1 hypothetical protein GCM10010994_01010 [Chelatococcus reniformis]
MSVAINTRMSRSDWLLLFALSLLWGGSFALVKVVLTALPPITVVAGRVSIAALFLVVALVLTRRALPRGWRVWRAFFTMGLWNNVVPWILFAYAQTAISSGLAAILNAATPLVTALVAHALTTDEKLSVLNWQECWSAWLASY